MINVNELRRGNLIFWNPKLSNPETTIGPTLIEVETISANKIGYITPNVEHRSEPFEDDLIELEPQLLSLEELEPIQLTKEFLEKAGFSRENNIFKLESLELSIVINALGNELSAEVKQNSRVDGIFFKPIQSLHQLQNLFFVLTGKELEMNL